jgi:hypothetical protein
VGAVREFYKHIHKHMQHILRKVSAENVKFKIVGYRQGESYPVGEMVDMLTEF